MGIFGFGALRDRFASIVPTGSVVRGCYVVCFDITPIVVYAVRHSSDEAEFIALFRRRLECSKEIRFLRDNPPYAMCYTLDNRAPRAKRETQIQRLRDSRSVVERITSVSRGLSGAAIVASSGESTVQIRNVVHRIREILFRDFVLTEASRRKHHRSGRSYVASATSRRQIAATKKARWCDREKAITAVNTLPADVVDTRNDASSRDERDGVLTFAEANRVEFDYREGEGEIKAINWLSRFDDRPRLVMAKDNDVFIYILSKMFDESRSNDRSDGTSETAISISWRRRDDAAFDATGKYLVFHENSNNVLLCWRHLDPYYDKCWLLLLWFGVCFGNDFAFGVLDKSTAAMAHFYSLIERHFVTINESIGVPFERSTQRVRRGRDSLVVSRNEDGATKILTWAFRELQNVLFAKSSMAGAIEVNAPRTPTWMDKFDDKRATNESDASKSSTNTTDEMREGTNRDDKRVRAWVARQLWSFFYTLELPSEFTKNQRFRHCPKLRINASFDKPYVSRQTFLDLTFDDLSRHVSSVLRNGV